MNILFVRGKHERRFHETPNPLLRSVYAVIRFVQAHIQENGVSTASDLEEFPGAKRLWFDHNRRVFPTLQIAPNDDGTKEAATKLMVLPSGGSRIFEAVIAGLAMDHETYNMFKR